MKLYSKTGVIVAGVFAILQVITFITVNYFPGTCYDSFSFYCRLIDWMSLPNIFIMWLLWITSTAIGLEFYTPADGDLLIYLPYLISVVLIIVLSYGLGYLIEKIVSVIKKK